MRDGFNNFIRRYLTKNREIKNKINMKIEYKKDGIEIDGEFLSLLDITQKCNDIGIKEDNLVILEMGWSSRSGDILEQRVLPLKSAQRIKKLLLNKEVYFGEIWGKHSEVYGEMCDKTFEINKDKKAVKEFLQRFPNGVDYDYSFIETYIENCRDGALSSQENEKEKVLLELESLI